MNTRISLLIISASLALTTCYLSTAVKISDDPEASTTGVEQTQEQSIEDSQDAASEDTAAAFLPGISVPTGVDWKNRSTFRAYVFCETSVPVYPVSEVQLEAGVQTIDGYVPVLSYEPDEHWKLVEEDMDGAVYHRVWFNPTPADPDESIEPLFTEWEITNFHVAGGMSGEHSFTELGEAANEATVSLRKIQSDNLGIENPTAEALWSLMN